MIGIIIGVIFTLIIIAIIVAFIVYKKLKSQPSGEKIDLSLSEPEIKTKFKEIAKIPVWEKNISFMYKDTKICSISLINKDKLKFIDGNTGTKTLLVEKNDNNQSLTYDQLFREEKTKIYDLIDTSIDNRSLFTLQNLPKRVLDDAKSKVRSAIESF